MTKPVRVTIWNEYLHELRDDSVAQVYPEGIHGAIAAGLEAEGSFQARTATLSEPDHGLGGGVLDTTDVLVWWGHIAHDEVSDHVVDAVQRHVLSGMGLVVLHSGHESKVFRRLLGTSGSLSWREDGDRERLWNLEPAHPVLDGIPEYFDLDHEEMYGEPFDVPAPDELLMISWFPGGEVFRSLCTWKRGHGKLVYFQPGHETYPTYHHPLVRLIIANACRWTGSGNRLDHGASRHIASPRTASSSAEEPGP